jgi:ABC-type bacteriocin/lantibiotic exporter with double-glycine peptidase domain
VAPAAGPHVGPWPLLLALLACIVVNSLLDLLVPWVMGFVFVDRVIRQARLDELWIVAATLLAIFAAQKLFGFLQECVYEPRLQPLNGEPIVIGL